MNKLRKRLQEETRVSIRLEWAARAMTRIEELEKHLGVMIHLFEDETSQGDGIQEEHYERYEAAKSYLEQDDV